MDFYKRESLPLIQMPNDTAAVPWSELKEALTRKPCNVVFLEDQGTLFGLISYGDMIRAKEAGLSEVPVNKNFSSIEGRRFMQAREFFKAHPNIGELPVLDAQGRMEGMCSRSDDLLFMEYSDPWEKNRYAKACIKKLGEVWLVEPSEDDQRRLALLEEFERRLQEAGAVCHRVSLEKGLKLQAERKRVLLVDEEFRLGFQALTEVFDDDVFGWGYVLTLKQTVDGMAEHAYDELISKLAESGVPIYNMIFTQDETTPGRRRLVEGFRKWKAEPDAREIGPHVLPSQAPAFYDEFYTEEYAQEVGCYTIALEKSDIYTRLKDCQDRYFHVTNGERLTVGQPENAERTIWFFGPCVMIGSYVEDGHTIESFLQQMLNENGYSAKVVNCGCYESRYQEMIHMTTTPMKPGDIVVMHLENRVFPGTETVDLTEILDQNDAPNEWLLDIPFHCNHKVNELYARDLYSRMVADGVLDKEPASGDSLLTRDLAINSLYLDLHFADYTPKEGERVGTIGMHGNPFTLGHQYLIETASKNVDRLFVLLIEDELGIFTYAERFAMAVDATRDLPNVTIVSGGPFQATRNVFREYFVKVEPTDMEESATVDALIYTDVIAPRLGITCRFFGDEKHNPKMAFFNDLMKKLLPEKGIDAIELPRVASKGKAISASVARTAAADGDLDVLLQNVPETTLRYLGVEKDD